MFIYNRFLFSPEESSFAVTNGSLRMWKVAFMHPYVHIPSSISQLPSKEAGLV